MEGSPAGAKDFRSRGLRRQRYVHIQALTAMTPDAPIEIPCMCGALRRAARAVTRIYDEELRATGLRNGQLGILVLLSRTGPVSQGRIGELLVLDHTTLSRSLRPLVAAGHVRVRKGRDRRERIVEVTDKGLRLLERAWPGWERAQARLREAVGEEQWRTLGVLAHSVTSAALRT